MSDQLGILYCHGRLHSVRQRWWLLGLLTVLGVLVLLRVLMLDTVVWHGTNNITKPQTHEWSWSVLPQGSPTLRWRIQNEIAPPSTALYNLLNPDNQDYSQNGQSCFVASIFAHKRTQLRTFLEAGAYNGEDLSNSLYLERELGWQGLLVEPDPWNYWGLRKRNRIASSLNACLAPQMFASQQNFRQSDTMSRLVESSEVSRGRGIFTTVVCYPLYSVLLAANYTTLDYLALDLEGLELQVLETIPWKEVKIKVIQVEASHLKGNQSKPVKNTINRKVNKLHNTKHSPNDKQNILADNEKDGSLKYIKESNHVNFQINNNIINKNTKSKIFRKRAINIQNNIKKRSIIRGENSNIKTCDRPLKIKDPSTEINQYSLEQLKLINFLQSKGYAFSAVIGEDLFFVRRDLIMQ